MFKLDYHSQAAINVQKPLKNSVEHISKTNHDLVWYILHTWSFRIKKPFVIIRGFSHQVAHKKRQMFFKLIVSPSEAEKTNVV